jgi:hypothetical protein
VQTERFTGKHEKKDKEQKEMMIAKNTERKAKRKTQAMGLLLAALVAACLMLVATAPMVTPAVAAVTFAVDRNDDPDPTTAKACTDAPNDCSLRGAIVAANAAAGADAITVPAGTYTLTRAGANEDATSTGDLDVTDELTITGAGARATSVAGGAAPYDDRIFENHSGARTDITGLTITGGKVAGSTGGGVANLMGILTLDGVAVKKNTAPSAGGVYDSGGTLNLTDSTVSGNLAANDVGGVLQTSGTVNITNSTISGNKATRFGGGVAASGAVMNIRNSTIANNESGRLGGGIITELGTTVVVKNTIVSGNSVDNCDAAQLGGAISSQGNNISSDDSCGFTQTTDKLNTNPLLGPLQNNGGPTDTRALLTGSPAIDTGANAACPATDQRGVARPQGPRCDIGAYERRNSPPVARNDSYDGVEDRTLTRSAPGVLRNDTDADGDTLRAARVSGPGKGTLSLNPNGSFSYKPPSNFNGSVSFVYRASDGRGGSDTGTVTLRIEARPG